MDPTTDVGPLSSDAHRRKVHGMVTAAQAAGVSVAAGGVLPQVGGSSNLVALASPGSSAGCGVLLPADDPG